MTPAPVADPGASVEFTTVDLDVGAVAHGGHCVARTPDGQVVFVRHALPGERVRALITEQRSGFLRADAIEVLTASPDRVEPPCPWARPDRCGGCDFQHASVTAQRVLKESVVREQLVRLGGLAIDAPVLTGLRVQALPDVTGEPAGLGWRTRVQYTVDATGRAGLLKHRSHEVVAVDWCRIAHPLVRSAPVLGREWPHHESVEVVASAAGEVTVLADDAISSGPAEVEERALGRAWTLSAQAFWQVHPAAAQTLATTVVELLAPRAGERAWDLYGGAGLFAAALAPPLGPTGRVTVVESDPAAVAAARKCLADLFTVTVVRADVARALANPKWRSVDLVVLDPPRSGAGKDVVAAVLARSPRAVAYVACDPAALGRDVRAFREAGWQLSVLRAYDLFPMTHHVECVALLTPGA